MYKQFFLCGSLFLLLSALAIRLPAQGYRWDNAFWQGLSFNQRLTSQWQVSAGTEFRMENNSTTLNQWIWEGGARYQPWKWLRLGAGYRLSIQPEFNEQRVDFSLAYKQKFAKMPLDVLAGMKFQKSFTPFQDVESTPLRPFLRVVFDKILKDFEPSIAAEGFVKTGAVNPGFTRFRLAAGVDYDLNKRNKLGFQYIFQRDVNQTDPYNTNIFRLSLDVELDFVKEKEKVEEKS